MPELPEVETIKLQLEKHILGKLFNSVKIYNKKSFAGDIDSIIGKKTVAVKRFGKMLVIQLEGDIFICIHLIMTGQLILVHSSQLTAHSKKIQEVKSSQLIVHRKKIFESSKKDQISYRDLPYKHIRVVINFESGEKLLFNDQRKFGWIKILDKIEFININYIKNLGPEPWDMADKDLLNILKSKKIAIKLAIMDQKILSGVGNIYANDALWDARILPTRSAGSLSLKEIKALRQSIIKVLKEGIRKGGSTAKDKKYTDLEGKTGSYQNNFLVYEQNGKKCTREEGGVIGKIQLGGRGTYFCTKCQK
ncbi:bifunctional DNA-formamidopyrimidine glycosylase/DNA-(apurinic or apyrimidinic site) lyase [Patescibacteria group bacterium]